MRGALFAAALLTVLYVVIQPKAASQESAATGAVGSLIQKFLSKDTAGLPLIAHQDPSTVPQAPGPFGGPTAPGQPGGVPYIPGKSSGPVISPNPIGV